MLANHKNKLWHTSNQRVKIVNIISDINMSATWPQWAKYSRRCHFSTKTDPLSLALLKVESVKKQHRIKRATLNLNTPFCRFGRQYHLGSKTKARVVQPDWLWILVDTDDNKENQSCKGQFPFTRIAIWEYNKKMFTKVVNKYIYTSCLVSFLSSFEAEKYGARIVKIGQKFRKLHLIKPSYYKVWQSPSVAPCLWRWRFSKLLHMACFCSLQKGLFVPPRLEHGRFQANPNINQQTSNLYSSFQSQLCTSVCWNYGNSYILFKRHCILTIVRCKQLGLRIKKSCVMGKSYP